MPSTLPTIKVRFVSPESLARLTARATESGLSVAAFLLSCAGEPYPGRGPGAAERPRTPERYCRICYLDHFTSRDATTERGGYGLCEDCAGEWDKEAKKKKDQRVHRHQESGRRGK